MDGQAGKVGAVRDGVPAHYLVQGHGHPTGDVVPYLYHLIPSPLPPSSGYASATFTQVRSPSGSPVYLSNHHHHHLHDRPSTSVLRDTKQDPCKRQVVIPELRHQFLLNQFFPDPD
jgi:hypothetical protein